MTKLEKFLHEQANLKVVGEFQYTFWYENRPCFARVYVNPNEEELRIFPINMNDNIGNGCGCSVTKKFKRTSEEVDKY